MGIRLAIIVGALLLLSSCLQENFGSHYRTYAEAVAAGAIVRGWIPKWLPSCEELPLLAGAAGDERETIMPWVNRRFPSLPSSVYG
jgi:hypothetical protein